MDTNKNKKLSLLQFLLIIAGILWVGVLAGTVYILPDISKTTKEEIRRVIHRDTLTHPDLEYNQGKIIPGVNISDILKPSEKLLAKGAELYKSSCASCHGDNGLGDGAGGATLNPKPRNFHKKSGWKNGREIAGMYKTLEEGISGSGMTAYEFLPVEEKFALIYFIRSMEVDFPPVTESELFQIDQIYDITSDRKGGASIPVKIAMENVIKEKSTNIDAVLTNINNSSNPAIELFNKITSCKKRAIQTLIANQEWKNGIQTFKKIITTNTKVNGFKAVSARLNATQIAELHGFLKMQF